MSSMTPGTTPASRDPWADPAGPDDGRSRSAAAPRQVPGFVQADWSSRGQMRQDLARAQDDRRTGFEPVSGALSRRVGDRPALSLVARAARSAGNLFRHDPTAERLQSAARGVQAPVTTGRRIAVVSLRGGAGKTTVAALLGRTYASLRPEPVAALDLDPGVGALALRLSDPSTAGVPVPSVDQLAAGLEGLPQVNQQGVTSLMGQAPDELHLTGPRTAGGPLGRARLTSTLATVSRFFPVTVVDCPTGLDHPDTAHVLTQAHAAVFAVPATATGVDEAAGYLRHWLQDPFLSAIPVAAVVTASDRASDLDPLAQAAALTRVGVMAGALRYDRHLAGGVGIRLPLIRPENRRATAELASGILAEANRQRGGAGAAEAAGRRREGRAQ